MTASDLRMPLTRVTAEGVSASKPDPEGFLKGAAELGFAPRTASSSRTRRQASRRAARRGCGWWGGPRAHAYAPTAYVPDLTHIRVLQAADGTLEVHVSS